MQVYTHKNQKINESMLNVYNGYGLKKSLY